MKNTLVRWLTGLVTAVVLGSGRGVHAAAPADIRWVADTSASMDDDIAEVKARIQEFDNAMTSAGIDARYALLRFGGNDTRIQTVTTSPTSTASVAPSAA